MITLDQCCFCIDLRTAGLVIAWRGVLSSIGISARSIYSYFELQSGNDPTQLDFDLKPYLFPLIIGSFISVVVSIFLIWGIVKNKKYGIIIWLLSSGFSLLVSGLVVVIFGISMLIKSNVVFGIMIFIGGMLLLAFEQYLWICVYSLYKKLPNDKKLLKFQYVAVHSEPAASMSVLNDYHLPSK